MNKIKITSLILLSVYFVLFNVSDTYSKKPVDLNNLPNGFIPYDVIIVPGVPYNDENWTQILLGRIYWSNYLYKNGIAKNIIFSGSAVYTPYIESEIMALYAKKLGIPEKNIFTERRAEHSVENIYYSVQIAKKLGFTKIALATDPFQSRMMKWPSRRMKIDIDFVPFTFEALDTMLINNIAIDANKAYVKDFVSIEERESFIKRLKGTIGRNIDYNN